MGALELVFRTEARRRWRSWVAITVLVGVVGGLVLAAAAAGARTDAAMPGFVAAHGFDTLIYSAQNQDFSKIAHLPGVAGVTDGDGTDSGRPSCDCTHPINPTNFGVFVLARSSRAPFKLVSGRMPDPSSPDQVLASFTLQSDYGVHLGSVIHVPFYATDQDAAVNDATGDLPRPEGPTVAFHVVGIEATEFEFPAGGAPSYDLYTTAAFAHRVLPRVATGYVSFVHLRSAADLPRFEATVASHGGYAENLDQEITAVENSIHPQAVGWWLLALLAGLVGLAVVGQALARQSVVEGEDYPTMRAIGADQHLLVALGVARNLLVGAVGATIAVAIATALSPIAPLGEARIAEPSTGVMFDAGVLLLGAAGIVVATVVLGIWPAIRAARYVPANDRLATSRPSAAVSRLAAAGAPPSAVIGVRNALERKSGGATVPVGSALLGMALAVIALCGTAVFGASLSHLTATPALYGDPFQLNISNPNGTGRPDQAVLTSLEHNRAVTRITAGIAVNVEVNKVAVGGVAGTALRGPLDLSTVRGHPPNGTGEIGLGVSSMRTVGTRIGSTVLVGVPTPSGNTRTVPFRVVAQVSFPVLGGTVSLGSGAIFTLAGYMAAACPAGPHSAACRTAVLDTTNGGILATVVPGPRGQATISHYLDHDRTITALAIAPTSLINFGEAVNFPLIFGAMLAIFGAATLLHLLVVSVARRRRDVGLLKVLGFVDGQVIAAVAWQATTIALVGALVGVPLGLVIGEPVWSNFANGLGVVPVTVVPVGLVVALVVGVVIVANVLAIVPALVATHARPGELLRTQ